MVELIPSIVFAGFCFVAGIFFSKREASRLALEAVEAIRGGIGAELGLLQVQLADEVRKSGEYFAKIQEIEQERNGWRDLYNDQASGHDNAQALMLSEISRLSQLYQRKVGEAPRLDPLIDTVREDWEGKHGKPARAQKPGQA